MDNQTAPSAGEDRNQPQQSSSPGIAKELETGQGGPEAATADSGAQEIELPKEVASAGVRVQPTTVTLPPPIQQVGVQPSGVNAPQSASVTATLPLSDDQIARGLKQSITTSWRWLAQWCKRRLSIFHLALKQVRGRLVRTRQ